MGLFEIIKDQLHSSFSFWDFQQATNMTENSKEARNILKSFAKRGYIKRVSRNIYVKL